MPVVMSLTGLAAGSRRLPVGPLDWRNNSGIVDYSKKRPADKEKKAVRTF
jgi:hypothetical protein